MICVLLFLVHTQNKEADCWEVNVQKSHINNQQATISVHVCLIPKLKLMPMEKW